ncbi:DUF3572 domain-containing protein [Jannaschia sp. S6380]|uniref:DUF3572 domain-containing protein n=1 Tax=Jannaschia sp. S6380 TaxID=2926408 RepID=UPI001FF4A6AD|nr:DUF3572 domain-containing protein [Jannaschia sp. S6380]MCK0167433.1 DUF3572 domain-containing protein [Jannaschia sp. S6380]
MTQDDAEVIALGALGWLAQADLLDAFQNSTGADRDTIRGAAKEPEFLGAVLDFVLMDDMWVAGACETLSLPHQELLAARTALPGGNLPHWT